MPLDQQTPSRKTPPLVDPTIDPATGKPFDPGANETNNTEDNIDSDDPDIGEDEGDDKSPDQRDVEPGSDADADDDDLGAGGSAV